MLKQKQYIFFLPALLQPFGGLMCLVTLLFPFSIGEAAYADDVSEEKLKTILLASRQNQAAYKEVTDVIGDQFVDANMRFEIRWEETLPDSLSDQKLMAAGVADRTGAAAVLWLDLETNEKVYFYITSIKGNRYMTRRLKGTGDEGVIEALALISRSAADFLKQESEPDTAPEEKEKPPRKAEKPKPPPEPTIETKPNKPKGEGFLFPEAAYSLGLVSTARAPQHGLELAVGIVIIPRIRLVAGYTLLQDLVDQNTFATLKLERHPIHVGVLMRWPHHRWVFEVGLLFTMDYTKRTPHLRREQGTVRNSYGKWTPILEPSVRSSLRLFGTVYLYGQLSAEVFLYRPDWTFAGAEDFFTDIWTAQPRVLLGATIGLF